MKSSDAKRGVADTTSFMSETALKEAIDKEEIKCDDEAGLVDVDLKMFEEDTDSTDAERREKDHPALYYTMTINWEENTNS